MIMITTQYRKRGTVVNGYFKVSTEGAVVSVLMCVLHTVYTISKDVVMSQSTVHYVLVVKLSSTKFCLQ